MPNIEEPFQSIANGDRERLVWLLDSDAGLAHARNTHGESALLYAAYRGHRDVVDILMDHGAVPTFFEAVTIGNVATVERLLAENPQRVSELSHDGWTALHLACHFNHLAIAELLLKNGADVNARSSAQSLAPGNTPLHAAIAAGHRDIAAFLLENRADPDIAQDNGMTPLHIAAVSYRPDLVHLLIDHFAEVEAQDNAGVTPLVLALKNHRDATAEALIARGALKPEVKTAEVRKRDS